MFALLLLAGCQAAPIAVGGPCSGGWAPFHHYPDETVPVDVQKQANTWNELGESKCGWPKQP